MAQLAVPLMIGGTLLSVAGQAKAGERSLVRGKTQKALNEVAAGQVIAIGQRSALEEKRRTEIIASRALAVASAGGAAQDIDRLIADISGEGLYRANLAMYEAETESERLKYEGVLAEQIGQDEFRAGGTQQLATVLSGGGAAAAAYK